ncbi:MAG: exodeoxyribonuclease VII small subunit [Firmicutes bacterium]|nr:exodeoxyribonuclease VII small subunit [Clostridiales bacterium]MBQ9931278.1 exodeoxyribonuclease VII small subunit [Bacillota bacterium]
MAKKADAVSIEINELSFEEALGKLESAAEEIKKSDISLENAIQNFENGVKYYERCQQILKDAKQKIEIYDKNSGVTGGF